MNKIRTYKKDGWEIQIKFDEDTNLLLYRRLKGKIKSYIDEVSESPYYAEMTSSLISTINRIQIESIWNSTTTTKRSYKNLVNFLDSIIQNEKVFHNENFHIRVWENLNAVGIETIWIKEDFYYNSENDNKNNFSIVINSNEVTSIYSDDCIFAFGMEFSKDAIWTNEIDYTFKELCEALEEIEEKTCTKKEEVLKKLILDKIKILEIIEDYSSIEVLYSILQEYENSLK
jgi:hypothetical protein